MKTIQPLPIGSCVDAPHKKPYSPKSTISPDVFVGAIVGNRDEGAIPWVHVSGQFFDPRCPCAGPFPNLLSHPTFCEAM